MDGNDHSDGGDSRPCDYRAPQNSNNRRQVPTSAPPRPCPCLCSAGRLAMWPSSVWRGKALCSTGRRATVLCSTYRLAIGQWPTGPSPSAFPLVRGQMSTRRSHPPEPRHFLMQSLLGQYQSPFALKVTPGVSCHAGLEERNHPEALAGNSLHSVQQ